MHDTVLRAYRSIDQFGGEYRRAWLFTITRRANVDTFRGGRPLTVLDSETLVGIAGRRPGGNARVSRQFDAVVVVAGDGGISRHEGHADLLLRLTRPLPVAGACRALPARQACLTRAPSDSARQRFPTKETHE